MSIYMAIFSLGSQYFLMHKVIYMIFTSLITIRQNGGK